jgi:diguanylate cyclase (GGDEF)-like protein
MAEVIEALNPRSVLMVCALLCFLCSAMLYVQAWIFRDFRMLLVMIGSCLALGGFSCSATVLLFGAEDLLYTVAALMTGSASYFIGSSCLVYLLHSRYEWKAYRLAALIALAGYCVWPEAASARNWNLVCQWFSSAMGFWFVWRSTEPRLRVMRRVLLVVGVMSVVGLTPGMIELALNLLDSQAPPLPLDTPNYRQRTILWVTSPLVLYACVMGVIHLRWSLRLKALVERDELTGVYTRERLFTFIEQAAKQPEHDLAVLMIDLDHFKSINDRYGHAAGDEALRQCAQLLLDVVRQRPGVLVRFGGEEFSIALQGGEPEEAIALAEQARERIAAHRFEWNGVPIGLTASIGVSFLSEHGSVDALLCAADAQLYQAKHSGRNRVVSSSAQGAGLARNTLSKPMLIRPAF